MLSWNSAFDLISEMNSEMEYGHSDLRVPNIIELESLADMANIRQRYRRQSRGPL